MVDMRDVVSGTDKDGQRLSPEQDMLITIFDMMNMVEFEQAQRSQEVAEALQAKMNGTTHQWAAQVRDGRHLIHNTQWKPSSTAWRTRSWPRRERRTRSSGRGTGRTMRLCSSIQGLRCQGELELVLGSARQTQALRNPSTTRTSRPSCLGAKSHYSRRAPSQHCRTTRPYRLLGPPASGPRKVSPCPSVFRR